MNERSEQGVDPADAPGATSDRVDERGGRVTFYMLAVNYVPLVYLVLGGYLTYRFGRNAVTGLGFAVAWIYLLPPILGRVTLMLFGRPEGQATPVSRAYKVWWLLTQLQMPFNRIPVLEEILRLVPGLYALWLNLWGSRVSLLAFWSPRVVITDRWLLHVGRGAVIGGGVGITGHFVARSPSGEYLLTVAEVRIGEAAIVGARVGISPGCTIHPGEVVPAMRNLGPYGGWKDGKRISRHGR